LGHVIENSQKPFAPQRRREYVTGKEKDDLDRIYTIYRIEKSPI
jgi:hypothetical protein